MVKDSPFKRITRGSVAKARDIQERRSKFRNDPIPLRMSSMKKRKANEISDNSGDSGVKEASDSDNSKENDIEEENKDVEYILGGTPSVTQRMQCYTNSKAMDDITKCLSERQLKRFRETTCFSHLLDIDRCSVQAQLFRCFMLHELKGSSSDAFLFHINGYTLRFTIREFALISGLKCGHENAPEFTFNIDEQNRMLSQYFQGHSKITKRQLVQSFQDKVWGEDDDDAVKFANLYFLHNFIMSEEPSSTKIYRKDFDLVESGRFVDYPWGNKAFDELTNNLHSKITLTGKYFRIHGFPLAMQIWLYECCSEVNPKIAKKVSDNIPRILNWETLTDQPRCDYLINSLFRIDRKKIVLRNITPTDTEMSSLQIPPEFDVPIPSPLQTSLPTRFQGNDSDDDFQTCPQIPRSQKGKEKVVYLQSPGKKKIRSDGSVGPQKQTNVAPKQPAKRTSQRHNLVSRTERIPQASKKPPARQTRNKTADKPSSSTSPDNGISRDEFEKFKAYVKEQFQDLNKLIKNNFKDVLMAIGSENNHAKADSRDYAQKSPSIIIESGSAGLFADVELERNRGTTGPNDLKSVDVECTQKQTNSGNNHPTGEYHFTILPMREQEDEHVGGPQSPIVHFNKLSPAQVQCICLHTEDSEVLRVEDARKTPVVVDKEFTGRAQRHCEKLQKSETEHVEAPMESIGTVDKCHDRQSQSVPRKPEGSETNQLPAPSKTLTSIDKQPDCQGHFVPQQPDDPEVNLSTHIENQMWKEKGKSKIDQHITESQFELPDELLPSLNTQHLNLERRMIIHPMAIVDSNPLAIVQTPPLFRRVRRPGPSTVSPFISSFGSESGSSSKKPIIFHQKYPFNTIFDKLDTAIYLRFTKWLTEGLLARHRNKKPEDDRYRKGLSKLQNPLELGVLSVSDKNWFYKMAYEGQLIEDSHIDVIMYYLRKKAKYSESTAFSFSTVDCNFSSLILRIWAAYSDLENGPCNASSEEVIKLYIKGFRLYAAVPWHTVDNIFIPVNSKDKFHWILLVLSFNDRAIMVYDSMRSTTHDAYVHTEVNKFAELIPTYLVSSGFYERRGIDLSVHPKYKLHSQYDPFEIVHVNDIPEQHEQSLDCGVYVAVYAEYLSDGNGIPKGPIDIELLRNRYATLLWDYGMRKNEEEAVSDNEAPVRLGSTSAPSDDFEHIVLQ